MTAISWLKGFLWTDYKRKKKEETFKVFINNIDTGIRLTSIADVKSISVETKYWIDVKEELKITIKKNE